MNRFFVTVVSIAVLGLVLGASCSKDKQDGGSEAEGSASKTTDTKAAVASDDESGDKATADGDKPASGGAAESGDDGDELNVDVEAIKTGIPECDQLIEKYVTCTRLDIKSRQAFLKGAAAWKRTIEQGGEKEKAPLAESCEQAMPSTIETMKAAGCE